MSKPKPIQINIPKPCHERWDEMTPSGNGRHCAHCDKVVTDFTKFTDKQLFDHFSQNINRHSCGRFTAMQVSRPILPPPQPHSKLYRLFIGLGLTLLLTQIPAQEASSKTPFVSCYDRFVMNEGEQGATGDDSVRITGRVIDEVNEPMFGAIVEIKNGEKIITGCATNIEGEFSLLIHQKQLTTNNLKLVTSYSSYKNYILALKEKNIAKPIIVKMDVMPPMLGDIIIIKHKVPLIDPQNPGTNTTITSDQIEKMPH